MIIRSCTSTLLGTVKSFCVPSRSRAWGQRAISDWYAPFGSGRDSSAFGFLRLGLRTVLNRFIADASSNESRGTDAKAVGELTDMVDRKLTLAFENLRAELPVPQEAAQIRGRQAILAEQEGEVLHRIMRA